VLTDQMLEDLLAKVAQQMPLLQKLVRMQSSCWPWCWPCPVRLGALLHAACCQAKVAAGWLVSPLGPCTHAHMPMTPPTHSQHSQVDNIALLDLLCSFRTFAAQSPAELVRPKVEDGGPLAIVQVGSSICLRP
jgi:hypothetical protein